jgi:hypothetical protein
MQLSGTFYTNGSNFVVLEGSSHHFSHAELSSVYSDSYDPARLP